MSAAPDRDAAALALNVALMALPVVSPDRPRLRDCVPLSGDVLARRARKFCSHSPEYADGANARFWAAVNDTRQRFPRELVTRRLPCVPFETGDSCLPGMEELARLARLTC